MSRLLSNIRNLLNYWMAHLHRPGMIYGFKHRGIYLKDTRISNTAIIENAINLDLGDNVFIGHYNFIEASNGIVIGEGCQITNFVSIVSHSSHHSIRIYGRNFRQTRNLISNVKGRVEIGEYTFIGPHSLVMPDTYIGKGSLVHAYSFVRGKFPDFAIISGNPASVIGDTRDADREFLKKHPEFSEFYDSWVEKKG